MHHRKVFGLLTAVSIFGVVGFGAGSAAAVGDIEALPVYACQWEGTGEPLYAWEGIYNTGNTAGTVECSVPSNSDVQVGTNWTLEVDDRSTSKGVSCEMRIVDTGGQVAALGGRQVTSKSGVGQQPIFWDWSMLTDNSGNPNGPIAGIPYFSCSLPAQGTGAASGVNGVFSRAEF